jgi:Trk K+ transport system NAD-binding subunit
MASETLIVVVGGDHLALEICREILRTTGHRTVLVWGAGQGRDAHAFEHEARALDGECGAAFTYHQEDPLAPGVLERVGLAPLPEDSSDRHCLVAVSQDDRLNLRVALAARDIDDNVQITLRQFNAVLGHKIQEGLKRGCIAVSPAAHAAATYAAAAVDPACTYAMPFPTLETMLARIARRRELHRGALPRHDAAAGLFGFSERCAEDFGATGMTIPQAEEHTRSRVVAVNGKAPYACEGADACHDDDLIARPLQSDDRVAVFGPVVELRGSWPASSGIGNSYGGARWSASWRDIRSSFHRVEPVLGTIMGIGVALYIAFTAYFMAALHLNPVAAMYFVTTTMTTVGYGDITACNHCQATMSWHSALPLLVAMATMIVGIALFSIITATVTSAHNSATVRRLQGLRKIHESGHVVVCGAGNVGSLVIDYLREIGERVVVIERNPDVLLIELARDRKIDLLTGDVTSDETIAYCAPEHAKALVGVTNSDTANLEAALGARTRARVPGARSLNVVMRIEDPDFGASIERHFGIRSFSTTELTAPLIAGLARFETTRGRLDLFQGTDYVRRFTLVERVQTNENLPLPAPPEKPGYAVKWVPLFIWREDASRRGRTFPIHAFVDDVRPGDRVLAMVPIDQFA